MYLLIGVHWACIGDRLLGARLCLKTFERNDGLVRDGRKDPGHLFLPLVLELYREIVHVQDED